MKHYLKIGLLVVTVSTFVLVSSCGKDNPYEGKPKAEAEKQILNDEHSVLSDSSLNDQEKAAKLAAIGQAVVESPAVAHLSLSVFEEELRLDDKNAVANFYSAAIAPVFVLKGFPQRMVGLLDQEDVDDFLENKRGHSVKP